MVDFITIKSYRLKSAVMCFEKMEVCFLTDFGYDINSTESIEPVPQELASWIHLKSKSAASEDLTYAQNVFILGYLDRIPKEFSNRFMIICTAWK